MTSLTWPSAATRAIDARTGIVIDEDVDDTFGVGLGLEAWLHETAHFVLLRGCLTIDNPANKEYWVGERIESMKAERGKRAGQEWGVDHEMKTLAVELLVADAIGFEIDMSELARYAIENGNLMPRWLMRSSSPERLAAAVCEIKTTQGSAEVIEAAAYLSRAIHAERRSGK